MRKTIKEKLPKLIEAANDNPGKHSIYSLSDEIGLCPTTIWKYCKELNLPIRKKKTYTDEQIEFIKKNGHKMTNAEACRAIGLKYYQASDIGRKVGIAFKNQEPKRKVDTRFFEHDDYYRHDPKR